METLERMRLYQQMYEREQERCDWVYSRLTLPVGISIGLGGWFGLLSRQNIGIEGAWWFVSVGLLGIAGGCLFITYMHLAKARLVGKDYARVPTPDKLETYWENLVKYYKKKSEDGSVKEDFSEKLVSNYAAAAAHNTKLNDAKAADVYCGARWLVITATIELVVQFVNMSVLGG